MASDTTLFSDRTSIIFDFDGTIADTFQLHELAFQNALKEYNLTFFYRDYLGMSTKETIRLIFEKNKRILSVEELEVLVQKKRKNANQLYQDSINFIADAKEFIELAYEYNFRLYVASSGSRMNVMTGLKSLGINHYFQDVVTADDVTVAKPHPEIFQKVLYRYFIQPANALVIEDAKSGIEAARAAGIDVVCVDTALICAEQYRHCAYFADFSTLIRQLKTELQDA